MCRRQECRLLVALMICATACAYDYASSCPQPFRNGRTEHSIDPPCDLSKENFCNTPGTNYPWHAIRRFVHENQGLMRRMYGDQRHGRVLKHELESGYEDEEETDGIIDELVKAKMMFIKTRSLDNSKPYFRPIQKTQLEKVSHKNETIMNVTKSGESNNQTKEDNETINSTTKKEIEAVDVTDKEIFKSSILYKDGTKLESIANVEINHLDPTKLTMETIIRESIESNSLGSEEPLVAKNGLVDRIDINTKQSDLEFDETTENLDDIDMTTEIVDKVIKNSTVTKNVTNSVTQMPVKIDTSTLPPTLLFSEHHKVEKIETIIKEPVKEEEFRPKPKPQQESVRPTVLKLRGANACGVKEEVVAPFWANNTRGELLALLNMYPFEQYVHWEKCTNENKQMYCRDGCRCEQQFRLHRLLAYDPNNECRGVFSDWFRFPACCVCKCYDIPLEYRVTSRSPRILSPSYDQDVFEQVHKDIYEDVTADWYSFNNRGRDDEF